MKNKLVPLLSRRPLVAVAAIVVFACAYWLRPEYGQAKFIVDQPDLSQVPSVEPYFESDFVSVTLDQYVHAASMTHLPSGEFMAVWFGGSREGARDVNIYSARFDPKLKEWGPNRVLVDRAYTEQSLSRMVRKLGNPVIGTAPDGRVWLFYVSVSVGGWAGSAINYMVSVDDGRTWSKPEQLRTSPFFNISTLVRGQPVFHQDGTIGLPVYHEFMGKFPEYLRIDQEGHVIDKARMDYGRDTLQPSTVVLSETEAVSVLRYSGDGLRRVLVSQTEETGEEWSLPRATSVPNPNSGLTAVRYSDDEILVVLNDLESDRYRLSLYLANRDLSQWKLIKVLEESPDPSGQWIPKDQYKSLIHNHFLASDDDSHQHLVQDFLARLDKRTCEAQECNFIYDYPYIIRDDADNFHLIYTWNKSMIKHVEFNKNWLEQYR